jgi:hypothetical protein
MTLRPKYIRDNGEVRASAKTDSAPPTRDNLEIPSAKEDEVIRPRKGEVLDIPEADLDLGDEEEVGDATSKPIISNPAKRLWFVTNPAIWSTAWLLQHKEREDEVEVKWHFVALHLQKRVKSDLTLVKVIPYISVRSRMLRLWVRAITDSTWYDSLLDKLLRQPVEFFEQYELRVKSCKEEGVYLVSKRARTLTDVTWPEKKTNRLLSEALGPDRMIIDETHDLYQDLISGTEV